MNYDTEGMAKILRDPDWSDIGNLPSNFFPYSFKELYIRPLTVQELRLFSKAAALNDMSHVVKAVDLCLSTEASKISIGDFYYVLMWLKIHSTPKTPYVVEWHCTEKVYRNKETGALIFNDATFKVPEELDKYELVDCGCHNSELVHLTDIEIVQLPEENWEGLPEGFDFPRASILQEVREALKDPELTYIAGPAQWIAHGDTLAEKIKFLETQKNLDMFDTAGSLNELLTHGIKETTTLHCRNCRVTYPFDIQLEPYNFFR